uniref:Uncharacterized protein n=1 Tax=viral metagenome TaxID=1070528 RepID=A0A6H1ZEI6_9ZZZZ
MGISPNIICSWIFVSDLAGSGEEVYLEPGRPFIGDSYDADEEIDRRIDKFETKTGLKILGVCLRGFRI